MSNFHYNHRETLSALAYSAMLERGLRPEYGKDALAQMIEIRNHAFKPDFDKERSAEDIQDQRNLLWCSIDNDDSKDLDQLTVCKPLKDGSLVVLVAIADVDSLVTKNSPIDLHARDNTTSVYTSCLLYTSDAADE